MGLSRRQFTQEFKLAAVRQLEQGISIAEVARRLEVNPNVLHRWPLHVDAHQFLTYAGDPVRMLIIAEAWSSARGCRNCPRTVVMRSRKNWPRSIF
jgi:hypothetical protein